MCTGDALKHCPCGFGTGFPRYWVLAPQRQHRRQCRPLARRQHPPLDQLPQWWCRLVAPVVWGGCGEYLGNQGQQCSEHLTGALDLPQQIVEA